MNDHQSDIKNTWHIPVPWSDIIDHCESKYKIIDWYWINEHDSNLRSLYDYWQKFQGKKFAANERLMVINHELTYYSSTVDIGNSLYNLFATLSHFDIPTNFLTFLVNYPAEREIKQLTQLFNLPMPHIVETEHWVDRVRPGITTVPDVNIKEIVSPFMCLNGRMRPHRVDVLCMLAEHNLIDKGIVTYNFASEIVPHGLNAIEINDKLPETFVTSGILYRTTVPFSRNNNLYGKNPQLVSAFAGHSKKFLYKTQSHKLVDSYESFERFILDTENVSGESQSLSYFMQRAAVQFIVESAMEYPYPYFTEKTWKSIMYSRPFVIASTPHTLKRLRDFGFKTFDGFWSEEYDNIENTADRICATVNLIKNISNLPIVQLQELVNATRPILEHNVNIYKEKFSKTDLQSVLNQL